MVQQVVGHLLDHGVGVEVEADLGAVPAAVAEPGARHYFLLMLLRSGPLAPDVLRARSHGRSGRARCIADARSWVVTVPVDVPEMRPGPLR